MTTTFLPTVLFLLLLNNLLLLGAPRLPALIRLTAFQGILLAALLLCLDHALLAGAVLLIKGLLLPGLLPLLFLLAIWLLSGQHRAIIDGTYVPPPSEEKKEKSFADLMYEAQMADLIERGIREEEEENERKYREYWEDKYRK